MFTLSMFVSAHVRLLSNASDATRDKRNRSTLTRHANRSLMGYDAWLLCCGRSFYCLAFSTLSSPLTTFETLSAKYCASVRL